MTVTGNPPATDADFDARIAHMLEQPDAPESWAATVERMARAMTASDAAIDFGTWAWEDASEEQHDDYRRLATAALRVVTEPVDGA